MVFPDISPVAFSILGFSIRWYAISYMLGFILGFCYIKHLIKNSTNNNISYKELDELFSYMIFGVIFGGRIGYTLFYNFNYYINNPIEIFQIWQGGMSFHGGLLGCIIALFIWCKKTNKNFFSTGDILCMAAPIGLFFGRIANFINGELYGRITTSSIGIIFPTGGPLPRHPSQLYEAITEGLIIFIILFYFRKIKAIRNRYGIIGFSFIGLYGLARFGVEFFRQPDEHIGFLKFGITTGQLLTLPMIIIPIIGIYILSRKKEETEIFTTSPLLNSNKITTRFFTRRYGVSSGVFANANAKFETTDKHDNVKTNRNMLLNTIGINAEKQLVTLNQSHTNEVIVIDKKINPKDFLNIKADGIITNQKNLAIGIITADCIPVLISDETNGITAALHCGWQGIYKDIIKEAIKKMKKLGANIDNIKVSLGPCLKKQSYEVDIEFKNKILKKSPKIKNIFTKLRKNDKFLFDCTLYCKYKLEKEGIKHFDILNFDTFKEENLFFSYRRSTITGDFEGSDSINEGRQLSIIIQK